MGLAAQEVLLSQQLPSGKIDLAHRALESPQSPMLRVQKESRCSYADRQEAKDPWRSEV